MSIEPGNLSLGVLAGGLIGTIVGHYLTKSRNTEERRITERIKAVAALRAAFAPSLAIIKLSKKHTNPNEPFPDVDAALREALLRQATEIELFRPYLCENQRTAYQEAWDKYVDEAWNYGWLPTTFRSDVADPWKAFEDLIHDILQFTVSKRNI